MRNSKRIYERFKAFVIENTLVGSTRTWKSTGTNLISNIDGTDMSTEILEMNVLDAACLASDLCQIVIPQELSENDL